jgi:serine/threonine protein kinase
VAQLQEWTRTVGEEPIPGYRLVEPLGQGGFGEVWKCEVSGGLHKAIKFVRDPHSDGNGASPATQELEALQKVKAIRHPFILSLERVEVVGDLLLIVMELADKSLSALQTEYQAEGQVGIPREELLSYLLEAAEALDWMNFAHGLQHLDIKPHNLFLVTNHIKVADFGLVHSLGDVEIGRAPRRQCGATPLYASPEILRGTLSRHSDQYSLAIVYQQLLTGTVPFWHINPYQLMMLHISAEPALQALPEADRQAVGRALSKVPEQRFPSCLDFLQALCSASASTASISHVAAEAKRTSTTTLRRVTQAAIDEYKARAAAGSGARPPATPTTRPSGSSGGPAALEVTAAVEPIRSPRVPVSDPAAVAPTSVALPGYRFLSCSSQSPLGDVWKVQDAEGRELRALCLYSFVGHDPSLIPRLEALQHPVIPKTQASWSPAGRLVLVTEPFQQTLRDRFDACRAEGQPGVPRAELLDCLQVVAEALDAIAREHQVPHLHLNPRNILLQSDGVRLADCGLVPLVWLPSGQPAGQLNPRYAAPELFERGGSPAADQYSLALIYAEMLSGMPPRNHRGPVGGAGSGQHRRMPRSATPTAVQTVRHGLPRIDLDLVPTLDRDILRRALSEDPQQRFPSCTALIEALAAATPERMAAADLYRNLPVVIPFRSLLGEPAPADTVLPSISQFVQSLIAIGEPHIVPGKHNIRYTVLPGGVWEYVFPTTAFPGTIRLKIGGFQQEWQAQLVSEEGGCFHFHINLEVPRRFRERPTTRPTRLELQLQPPSLQGTGHRIAEARVRLRLTGGDPTLVNRILPGLAPQLFDSIRSYLQASPEQRSNERRPCSLPLHAYPVLPDLELGEVLEGTARNVSVAGISFRVARKPAEEKLYLHWHKSPTVSSYAVLAQVVRIQPAGATLFDVGAAFSNDAADLGLSTE